MSRDLPVDNLDTILALQLSVAWAGEAAGDPPRLGWWKTDLVDPEAGGDLFARLTPKTAAWASLSLVREAARRVDEAARANLARPDGVWTLFHFGFALDEQLADRLAWHRSHQQIPAAVLGPHFIVGKPGAFDKLLASLPKPKVERTPSGRKLQAKAAPPAEAAALLAAALRPLAPSYPLPFLELEAR
jgi:hypothetical protein